VTNPVAALPIRDFLSAVSMPVRLVLFEEPSGAEGASPTRRLLEQLAELNPYVTVDVRNLAADHALAALHRVDRAPAVVVSSQGRDRVRFYGAPVGHELTSLLEAIRMTAAGDSGLSTQTRALLSTLTAPVQLYVFFTPTCVSCPQMVNLANRLAVESPMITATAIDATAYPDLVGRYRVNGVPKTIVNDATEFIGTASEADVVAAILGVKDLR
jgi:glutaredoxin-like protein